jgi:hypothetical protein
MSSSETDTPRLIPEVVEEKARAETLKLYELCLQEYRFQILLNWDRAKHTLVSDGVLIGAAGGLWKLNGTPEPPVIVGLMLLFVALSSILAIAGGRRGHEYYRNVTALKTNLETALGLQGRQFALTSTRGMLERHEPQEVALTPSRRFARWLGRVNTYVDVLLFYIAIVAAWGAYRVFF